jgi:hypothetical protein
MKAGVGSLPLIPPLENIDDLLWVSTEVAIELVTEL